jgi:preprotein translocase subunit SecA
MLLDWVEKEIEDLVGVYWGTREGEHEPEVLLTEFGKLVPTANLSIEDLDGLNVAEAIELFKDCAEEAYQQKEQEIGADVMRQAERAIVLRIIDSLWVRHLTALDDLRQGIGLRAYGQRDPLVEYKVEAANMFEGLLGAIQHDVAHTIFHVSLNRAQQAPPRPRSAVTNRGGMVAKAGRKIGRNEPCYCGSGKKFKFCCGR